MQTKQGNKVFSNFLWRFMERCGAQGVSFIVSIVLARLLEPSVYGTVALITVFTTILNVFIDSGFGQALVQKKDADETDFSSVFYFMVVFCLLLYGLMFACAPLIALFYKQPDLTPLVRVMSLQLLLTPLKNVQHAYVSRTLQFRRFFFSTLGGTVGAAVVGIVMAYLGFGVWALIAQHLFNTLVDSIVLWFTVRWRPKKIFSFSRLKSLFSYGWKMLVSRLIDAVYGDIRQLIIGKLYSTSDLAFYNKGKQFPNLIVTNINTSIDSVLLPTMSNAQDDRERVRAMTRRAIKVSTYLMMPMMMGLAVCAAPLVDLILTAKWLPSVFFLRIFCITMAFYPVQTANLNAIKAMGRSDLFLRLEIMKKCIGIVLLLSTMWISVEAMAYSLLISMITSQLINAWPNRKLLGYRYTDQLWDMLPQILLSCFMGAAVYCVTFLGLSDILTLCIQVPLGALIYIGGSKLLHFDSFEYVLSVAKSYLHKGKKA